MSDHSSTDSKRREPRTAGGQDLVWQNRTDLVKQQTLAENKASDAKTARLRALRLAKEHEDAQAKKHAPAPKPKRTKRTIAS